MNSSLFSSAPPPVYVAARSQAEWDEPEPGADASLCPAASQRRTRPDPMQHHSLSGQDRILPQRRGKVHTYTT